MKAKKLFALLLVLAMVLSLAACGNSAPAAPAAGSNAGEGTAESAAADPNAVGNDPYADPYADPYKNGGQGNDPYNDPYKNQGNDPYSDPYKTGDQATQAPAPAAPSAEEYMPEAGENYTVTKTADGWIQIENKPHFRREDRGSGRLRLQGSEPERQTGRLRGLERDP